MPNRKPPTSARLRRAAAAEVERLEAEKRRLSARRDSLSAELRELEERAAALDDRIQLLRELAANELDPPAVEHRDRTRDDADRHALKGPAIRETAVKVLAGRADPDAPIHYRAWLELVHDAGYLVDGADEAAVFLSQISRSPVVTRTSAPGTYRLDLDAPDRLRTRLDHLHGKLREVTAGVDGEPTDLAQLRKARRTLTLETGRVERELEEALRVLDDQPLRVVESRV